MRIVDLMLHLASPAGCDLSGHSIWREPVVRRRRSAGNGRAQAAELNGACVSGTSAASIQEEKNSGQHFKETGR
jgi:hypothetical protein